MSGNAVDFRVRMRRLLSLHRGVYLVGPVVHARAREMAAVLACGTGAVLSHRSAAVLWGLCPRRGDAVDAVNTVDVTITRGHRGRRQGIRVHRVSMLPRNEVTRHEGIPVTTPSRTLLDLAGAACARDVERAVAQATRSKLADRAELMELVVHYSKRRGAPVLRALLEAGADPAFTRSEAEEHLRRLIDKAQLPSPETNTKVGRDEVDFVWRAQRLVVEVDGFAFHSSRASFEEDRRRDSRLVALGYRVVRITWRQLTGEPEAVLVRLAQAMTLAMPGARGPA